MSSESEHSSLAGLGGLGKRRAQLRNVASVVLSVSPSPQHSLQECLGLAEGSSHVSKRASEEIE